MKSIAKTVWIVGLLFPVQVMAQTPVYLDDSQPIEARIDDALSRMTLE